MPANFEDAFRAHMRAQSTGVSTRWYLWEAPEGATAPYAVVTPITEDPIHIHGAQSDLQNTIYQIDVHSPSQSAVVATSRQIRQYLEGFQGSMENVNVRTVMLVGSRPGRDEVTKFFIYSMDFQVMFHETMTPYAA